VVPENTGEEREEEYRVGPGRPPREYQFKPGNPGRPKGSRNKLSEDFFRALADDFAENGIAAIVKMRADRPNEYAKMVASLMTKEIEANVSVGLGEALDALDDDGN
jgi:hypothetical protein